MRVFRVDYPEIVDQLVELFVESTPPLLDELRAGAESGDGEAVRRAAHKLKGSCQNIGAGFMARLAHDLERTCTAATGRARRARAGLRGHARRVALGAAGGRVTYPHAVAGGRRVRDRGAGAAHRVAGVTCREARFRALAVAVARHRHRPAGPRPALHALRRRRVRRRTGSRARSSGKLLAEMLPPRALRGGAPARRGGVRGRAPDAGLARRALEPDLPRRPAARSASTATRSRT